MAALIDTNVLVYRYDPRFPHKQRIASELLREGVLRGDLRLPHQAIVEFVSAVTRAHGRGRPLLSVPEACREAEELMSVFEVLYPDDALTRLALRGVSAYQLSWFDAHLWAYAERYGLHEIVSEDFDVQRLYGTVRVRNPFRDR